MSFQERLLSTVPIREPDVKIFFHGQLLLRSEDMTCDVGVNPLAANHVLSVEARTKMPDNTTVIQMRHFGPIHFRQPGMTIEVSPPADTRAAWKCISPDPVDHVTGDGAPTDFRWMLNLEGRLFHDMDLRPNIFDTQHTIKLQNGEYFFFTARRSHDRLNFVRKEGGKSDLILKRIGAIARASVFLVQDQSVLLKWNDGVQERICTLTKSLAGATHEIYIENTPLFIQPNPMDLSQFEELTHYYKVIPEISAGARFKLEPMPIAGGDVGSPDIPCQPMTLDGPGG